ncbi:hypothetical protein GEOBRER4_n2770 [Citrifermentans bremense]|uniref:Uncharacterized protein n=1 Tax=Citrifermentans bremense TaxID=60035 RepID=A0A6S6M3E5_9BACT|nr:hypothetical protein [Citrifermentans bremense]BCG47919.1 hypothetical protein GEOBRER4_n2770 [Citrifermentans bremense]
MSKATQTKEEQIQELIQWYQNSLTLKVGEACQDGCLELIFPRLERAAMNQANGGDATVSRYAIWANTLRDCIIACIRDLGGDAENREVIKKLVLVANALSAFSDIQALYDPMKIGSLPPRKA